MFETDLPSASVTYYSPIGFSSLKSLDDGSSIEILSAHHPPQIIKHPICKQFIA